LIYSFLMLHLR